MTISTGIEISRFGGGDAPRLAPVGMHQQIEVTALHHFHPKIGEADNGSAHIVGFPFACENARAGDDLDDLAVGQAVKRGVQGAQREHQAVAAIFRETGRIRTGIGIVKDAPEAHGGDRAHFKQPVKRQDDGRRVGAACVYADAEDRTAMMKCLFVRALGDQGVEGRQARAIFGISEVRRRLCQSNDAWEGAGRPRNVLGACLLG